MVSATVCLQEAESRPQGSPAEGPEPPGSLRVSNEATAGFRKTSTRQFISLGAIGGVLAPGFGGYSAHSGVRNRQTSGQRGGTQPPAPATSGGGPADGAPGRHLPCPGHSSGGPIELPGTGGPSSASSESGDGDGWPRQVRPQKPVTSEWERPILEGP